MGLITAALVTAFTQWVKQNDFFNSHWKVVGLCAVVSLVGAAGYSYLVAANYWSAFASIMITANAIYAIFIAGFES